MDTGLFMLLFIILLCSQKLAAQDLYTEDATGQFANYLFTKGEFEYAAEEYERLLFMNPQNDTTLIRLSESYRKLGAYSKASDLFIQHRGTSFSSQRLEQEYLATILFQKDQQKFDATIHEMKHLDYDTQLRSKLEFSMLTRNWQDAENLIDSVRPDQPWVEPYEQNITAALAFRSKKPWLAGTYSAILPGSGKIYAKNAKEGITSFLFVAALAYQSYRGFNKRGSKSLTGWVYGGLSLGFYLGNIYGAQQSAKNYNRRTLKLINDEVDHTIYSRY